MTIGSPLQNRVRPDAEIVATTQRGMLFGNRGGRIHDPVAKRLYPTRRWASKQWICCVLAFKNRQRTVMGPGSYTELFFLDEVTALAAGHRPCFECRRVDALAFAEAWQVATGQGNRPSAGEMDSLLHQQRLSGRVKKTHEVRWAGLPDGAVVMVSRTAIAKRGKQAWEWSHDGYVPARAPRGLVDCLTPPATLGALESGYTPLWHPSAPLR